MIELVQNNATRVARAYKRKCWWISLEDVQGEAVLAQLSAAPRYDPERGRTLALYLYSVALHAAHMAVLRDSAPVSSSHDARNLIGLYREDLEVLAEAEAQDCHDRTIIARQIRDAMVASIGEQAIPLVLGVFVEGWKPAEVAESNQVPVREVYGAVDQLRRRLQQNETLFQMWREGVG